MYGVVKVGAPGDGSGAAIGFPKLVLAKTGPLRVPCHETLRKYETAASRPISDTSP
jgi:hypothetical protein